MRILLAVDATEASERAVKEVAARPWPPGSEVRLLRVVENVGFPAALLWYDASGDVDGARRELLWRAEAQTAGFLEILESSGIRVDLVLREGKPGPAILGEATKWKADMIVVGSHEHGSLKRWLTGSVSQYLLTHARCSIEVVH
jgi:nucleotide-binding universal stress UspA family protein